MRGLFTEQYLRSEMWLIASFVILVLTSIILHLCLETSFFANLLWLLLTPLFEVLDKISFPRLFLGLFSLVCAWVIVLLLVKILTFFYREVEPVYFYTKERTYNINNAKQTYKLFRQRILLVLGGKSYKKFKWLNKDFQKYYDGERVEEGTLIERLPRITDLEQVAIVFSHYRRYAIAERFLLKGLGYYNDLLQKEFSLSIAQLLVDSTIQKEAEQPSALANIISCIGRIYCQLGFIYIRETQYRTFYSFFSLIPNMKIITRRIASGYEGTIDCLNRLDGVLMKVKPTLFLLKAIKLLKLGIIRGTKEDDFSCGDLISSSPRYTTLSILVEAYRGLSFMLYKIGDKEGARLELQNLKHFIEDLNIGEPIFFQRKNYSYGTDDWVLDYAYCLSTIKGYGKKGLNL